MMNQKIRQKATPEFEFEENEISITGNAISEFPLASWGEFIEDLNRILKEVKELTIHIRLNIVNSSNSKFMSKIFYDLDVHRVTCVTTIKWYHHINDEDMQFLAEFYVGMYHKLKFEIIPFND